jgi:hypothetical protein
MRCKIHVVGLLISNDSEYKLLSVHEFDVPLVSI